MAQNDNTFHKVDNGHSRKTRSVDGWKLTELAFNKLLSSLSPDRDEAANLYELLRRKLIRFCESNQGIPAEDGADEIINRVARKIDEGVPIANVFSYAYGVAKLVLKEFWRETNTLRSPAQTVTPLTNPDAVTNEDEDIKLQCLDSCLQQLSKEHQTLLLEYYREERHAKIELRRELAEQMKIPLNALRIRVHRIRRTLEDCMRECLAAAR